MKLRNCKKCRRVSWRRYFEPGPYLFLVYYVQCLTCEARTPDCSTPYNAIRSWNRMNAPRKRT